MQCNYRQNDLVNHYPRVAFVYNNKVSASTKYTIFFPNYSYQSRGEISPNIIVQVPISKNYIEKLVEI